MPQPVSKSLICCCQAEPTVKDKPKRWATKLVFHAHWISLAQKETIIGQSVSCQLTFSGVRCNFPLPKKGCHMFYGISLTL